MICRRRSTATNIVIRGPHPGQVKVSRSEGIDSKSGSNDLGGLTSECGDVGGIDLAERAIPRLVKPIFLQKPIVKGAACQPDLVNNVYVMDAYPGLQYSSPPLENSKGTLYVFPHRFNPP